MSIPDAPQVPIIGVGTAIRTLSFLVLWVILIGTDPLNVIVGLSGAIAATWASLLLIPPCRGPISPLAVAVLIARLPLQSLLAGVDVARRALDPRLPVQPGFVSVPSRLPPGPSRNAFRALMSLQPGSMPVSIEADGDIVVHCLDMSQPVAAQMAAEEAVFLRLLGRGTGGG